MLRLFIQRLLNKQNPFMEIETIFIIFTKNTVTIRQYFSFNDISSSYIDILFNIYLYYFYI